MPASRASQPTLVSAGPAGAGRRECTVLAGLGSLGSRPASSRPTTSATCSGRVAPPAAAAGGCPRCRQAQLQSLGMNPFIHPATQPQHLSPPHPLPRSLPLPPRQLWQRQGLGLVCAPVRPPLPDRPDCQVAAGPDHRLAGLQAGVARLEQGRPAPGAGGAARRGHPGCGRLVPALCRRHLDQLRLYK